MSNSLGDPGGVGRAKPSSWQPDVGGEAEEEINWCQSGGRRGRQEPRGPKSGLGAGGRGDGEC